MSTRTNAPLMPRTPSRKIEPRPSFPKRRGASRYAVAGALLVAATVASPRDGAASGGFFRASEDATSVVSAHRIVMAIAGDRTVLWDQIEYSGEPDDFAWVLPARPGAYLELSSDAWIEALDSATAVRISRPSLTCDPNPPPSDGSFSCGCLLDKGPEDSDIDWSGTGPSAEGARAPVVRRATVGPYATATIHGGDPSAISKWLRDNGYHVDPVMDPILADYANEGFDFIALRLSPGEDVSAMRPVRVVSPSGAPIVPLRMLNAGASSAVPITLTIIGEARYQPQNFPSTSVSPEGISWDYETEQSNWESVRIEALRKAEDRTWLTTYAQPRSLPAPTIDPAAEASDTDARELDYGSLPDMAVALVGMRPANVWVTRLEASLPKDALKEDLQLEAIRGADTVEAQITPADAANPPCPLARPLSQSRPSPWTSAFAGAVALLAGVFGRRAARARSKSRSRR